MQKIEQEHYQQQQNQAASHFRKNNNNYGPVKQQPTIAIIAEDSGDQLSSSITPIAAGGTGANSKGNDGEPIGATPTPIGDDQMMFDEWPQKSQMNKTLSQLQQQQEHMLHLERQNIASAKAAGTGAGTGVKVASQYESYSGGPALPHFHLCQNITGEVGDEIKAESPPGLHYSDVLTPMGAKAQHDTISVADYNDALLNQEQQKHQEQEQEESDSCQSMGASSTLMSQTPTQLQNRPFRSVSPVKTLKLLRNIENLQPRSEQNFMDVIEKDMSSSEESSPMYQRFKQKKQYEQQKQLIAHQKGKNNSQIDHAIDNNSNKKSAVTEKDHQQNAAIAASATSPSHQSSQNDRSVGVPQQTQDKSDHDGAKSAQQHISPSVGKAAQRDKQGEHNTNFNNNLLFQNSLTASSEEREKIGYDKLHRLAGSLRKDAYEISQLNCRSLEETAGTRLKAAQNRVRGSSFMEKDLKTRKKEKIRVVFAISDAEFKQIKKSNRQLQSSSINKQVFLTTQQQPHSARPVQKSNGKAPADSSSFSIKLQLTDQPGGEQSSTVVDPMASRKSADHANRGMRHHGGSTFHIPIMPCQIESSESEEQQQAAAQHSQILLKQQQNSTSSRIIASSAAVVDDTTVGDSAMEKKERVPPRPQQEQKAQEPTCKMTSAKKYYLAGQNSFDHAKYKTSTLQFTKERMMESGENTTITPEQRRNTTQQIEIPKPLVAKAASLNKVTSDEKKQLIERQQKLHIPKQQTSSLISSSSSSSDDACSPADGGRRSSLFYDYDNQMKLQIEEHHHLYSPSAESNNRVSKVRNLNQRPNLALKLNKMPNIMTNHNHTHFDDDQDFDDKNDYSSSNLFMLEHNSHRHEMLSQKSPSPRQQNELIGPTASGGYCSPDKDGGHTERTHNKGRTLRFNLHQCDLQGSSTTNDQISNTMHHHHHHRLSDREKAVLLDSSHHSNNGSHNFNNQKKKKKYYYIGEKSFDNMEQDDYQERRYNCSCYRGINDANSSTNGNANGHGGLHLPGAPTYSQDSKSVACNSECRSEHYIRAKKFAALRTTNQKKMHKKSSGGGGVYSTLSFKNNKSCSQLRKHSPQQVVCAADSSSLYIFPQESESLRKAHATVDAPTRTQAPLAPPSLKQQKQASEPQSAGFPASGQKFTKEVNQVQATYTAAGNLTSRGQRVEGRGCGGAVDRSMMVMQQQSSTTNYYQKLQQRRSTAAKYNSPVQTTKTAPVDRSSKMKLKAAGADETVTLQQQPSVYSNKQQLYNQTSDSIKILPEIRGAAIQNDKDTSYFSTVKEAMIEETSQSQRNLHCTAITPNNLNKINKNFSNFAKELGDDESSDDDWHEYLSKQMNVSHQSPMEFQKRLRCNSKDQFYPDSASVTGGKSGYHGGLLMISATKTKEPMTGTKKKSILKNSSISTNQIVKEKSPLYSQKQLQNDDDEDDIYDFEAEAEEHQTTQMMMDSGQKDQIKKHQSQSLYQSKTAKQSQYQIMRNINPPFNRAMTTTNYATAGGEGGINNTSDQHSSLLQLNLKQASVNHASQPAAEAMPLLRTTTSSTTKKPKKPSQVDTPTERSGYCTGPSSQVGAIGASASQSQKLHNHRSTDKKQSQLASGANSSSHNYTTCYKENIEKAVICEQQPRKQSYNLQQYSSSQQSTGGAMSAKNTAQAVQQLQNLHQQQQTTQQLLLRQQQQNSKFQHQSQQLQQYKTSNMVMEPAIIKRPSLQHHLPQQHMLQKEQNQSYSSCQKLPSSVASSATMQSSQSKSKRRKQQLQQVRKVHGHGHGHGQGHDQGHGHADGNISGISTQSPNAESASAINHQQQAKHNKSGCSSCVGCVIGGEAAEGNNNSTCRRRQSCQLTASASQQLDNQSLSLTSSLQKARGQHDHLLKTQTHPQFHSQILQTNTSNCQHHHQQNQHQHQQLQQRRSNKPHLISEFLKNYNNNQSTSPQGGQTSAAIADVTATDPHFQQTFGKRSASKFDDGVPTSANGRPQLQDEDESVHAYSGQRPQLQDDDDDDFFNKKQQFNSANDVVVDAAASGMCSNRAVRYPSPPSAVVQQFNQQKHVSKEGERKNKQHSGNFQDRRSSNSQQLSPCRIDEANNMNVNNSSSTVMRRYYLQNLSPQKSITSNQDYESPSGLKSLIKMSNPHPGMAVQSLSPPLHKTQSAVTNGMMMGSMIQYESGHHHHNHHQFHLTGGAGALRNVNSQLGNYMSNNDQQMMIAHKRQLLISQHSGYQQRYHGGTFGRPANTNGTNDDNDGNSRSSGGFGEMRPGKPQTTLSEMIIPQHAAGAGGGVGGYCQPPHHHQQLSEEQLSTGVAFFGGASSSGNGGAVQGCGGGLQYSQSNTGLSPQAAYQHPEILPSAGGCGFEYALASGVEEGEQMQKHLMDNCENAAAIDHDEADVVDDDSQGATRTAIQRPILSDDYFKSTESARVISPGRRFYSSVTMPMAGRKSFKNIQKS